MPRLVRVCHKAISATWHRLDKLHASRTLTQCFPQKRDVLRQISFFDKGVGPNSLHQIVFCHYLPAVLDKRHENVENLGSKRNLFTFTQQDTFRDFQAETTKFVAVIVLLTH
jgi:hypothetical protein